MDCILPVFLKLKLKIYAVDRCTAYAISRCNIVLRISGYIFILPTGGVQKVHIVDISGGIFGLFC